VTLHISADLDLPLEFATEAWAILARRGAGKSNAGVVVAEELHAAGLPFVAIDPKGDWWGIRSSADGTGPGLAVPVFGGRHGDVPLESTAGALIADLVLGDQSAAQSYLSCVLDVSSFSKGEARRFLHDFADRLFRGKDESGVLTLIFEEAHEYLPQRVGRDEAQLVAVFQRIVKQGRQRGLGCGMLTQRSASLNKDVLTQVGARSRCGSCRRRIAARSRTGSRSAAKRRNLSRRYTRSSRVRAGSGGRNATTGSSASPSAAAGPSTPARPRNPVNAAPSRAPWPTSTWPTSSRRWPRRSRRPRPTTRGELRKRIRELERQLTEQREPVVERVEVPVLADELAARLDTTLTDLRKHGQEVASVAHDMLEQLSNWQHRPPEGAKEGHGAARVTPARATPAAVVDRRSTAGTPTPQGSGRARPSQPPSSPPGSAGELTRPQQRILDALAWLAAVGVEPASRIQAGMIAGYHPRTKGFTNGLGTLSSGGYITYPQPGYVTLTDAGAATAQPPDSAPTSEHLQQMIYQQVGNARARILRELVDVYPDSITRADLAARLDYHERTKGFTNALGSLRTLGLVDYPTPGVVAATDLLFLDR
jgi:hypothetical protein